MNWLPISILVIIALIAIVYIASKIQKEGLRKVMLEAILKAEQEYNSTTGKERLKLAISYVYDNYSPVWLKAILPEQVLNSLLEKWIQELFDEVKSILDFEKGVEVNEKK